MSQKQADNLYLFLWPKIIADSFTNEQLQNLATHCLDNRYYEHRVAKYP